MEPRDKIQVISGPRQVGKSTLVKQVLQETTVPHLLVSADNVEETNNAWIGEMWAIIFHSENYGRTVSVDTSGWESGVYIARAVINGKDVAKKITIRKF